MTDSTETRQDGVDATAGAGTTGGSKPPVALLAAGLAIVLVLAVALGIVLWKYAAVRDDLTQAQDRARDVSEARDAAFEAALAMSEWDYRSIEDDHAWYDELTTEDFRQTLPAEELELTKADVRAEQSHADAEVIRIVAERNGDGSVTALAFVDQRVSFATGPENLLGIRLELTMVEQDGRWLINDLAAYNLIRGGGAGAPAPTP